MMETEDRTHNIVSHVFTIYNSVETARPGDRAIEL